MPEYQEYPLVMTHPAQRAPVITPIVTDDPTRQGATLTNYRSTPAQLPPVTVMTADQEAEYEAKGYKRAGTANAMAFEAQFAAPWRPGSEGTEWPKMINGVLTQDPSIKGGPIEYPKWVGDDPNRKLVKDEAEEMAWLEKITAAADEDQDEAEGTPTTDAAPSSVRPMRPGLAARQRNMAATARDGRV